MTKRLKLVICSPGGNITGLVLGRIARANQVGLARRVIRLYKNIEQVGYVTKPRTKQALARLEMAGGEFCGNAARALAFAITQGIVPFVPAPKLPAKFRLEVSGTQDAIACFVRRKTVQVEIPLPKLTPIYQVCESYHIVHLEGISYILVPQRTGNMNQARKILNKRDLKPLKAAGVIYYGHRSKNVITMKPYVLVSRTGSFVPETSSASSAIALSIREVYQDRKKDTSYTVVPPSGMTLKTRIRRRGDYIQQALVKGPVKILEVKQISAR